MNKKTQQWKAECLELIEAFLDKLGQRPCVSPISESITDQYYEVHVPTYKPYTYSATSAHALAQWLARNNGDRYIWRPGRTFRIVNTSCRECEFEYIAVLDIDTGKYHAMLVKE